MSQKTLGVSTFALRHLHLRTWDCIYSLHLCWAWAPDFAQGIPWPTTPMPPPGKHWPCGRTSGVIPQAAAGFFTFSPYFWVAGSCNGQPWPLPAVFQANARACFPRGEQKRPTLVFSAFSCAATSISCPLPESKCTTLLPLPSPRVKHHPTSW